MSNILRKYRRRQIIEAHWHERMRLDFPNGLGLTLNRLLGGKRTRVKDRQSFTSMVLKKLLRNEKASDKKA